jgi:hypothetical protein
MPAVHPAGAADDPMGRGVRQPFSGGVLTVVTVATIATVLKLVVVWLGYTEGGMLADDAFYYFRIAQNVASGSGSTFDGLAPTNGYHPLWLGILVPIFKIWRSSLWTPIYVAQSVTVLLDLISGLLLYHTIAAAGLASEAFSVAILWFISPLTACIGLRGMEASVSCLLILLLAAHLTRISRKDDPLRPGSAVGAGIWLGLAGLARTDNLVILGIGVSVFAVLVLRRHFASVAALARWLAIVAVTSAVVVAPWLLWNFTQFGSVIQTSGQVKLHTPGVYGALHANWSGLRGIVKTIATLALAPLLWPTRYLAGEEFRPPILTCVATGGLVVCFVVSALAGGRALYQRIRDARFLALPCFSLLYLVLHTVLYAGWWRIYASWYALPYLAFLTVLQGMLLGAMLGPASPLRPALGRSLAAAQGLLVTGLTAAFAMTVPHVPKGPEKEFGPTLEWLAEHLPRGSVLGAFNAGRLGYIASKHPFLHVTNLDGLVNNEAYDAARRGTYRSYVVGRVDVLTEDPMKARMFLSPAEVESLGSVFQREGADEIWSNRRRVPPR